MAQKLGKTMAKFSAWASPTGGGGITAQLGGDATAVGSDTLAEGDASLEVRDLGAVTIVKGSTTFSATSESTDGTQAFATASSFATVSGADNVLTKTTTSTYPDSEGGDSTWSETSTTNVFAVDVEGITLSKTLNISHYKTGGQPSDPVDPDGNVATLDADVQVMGDNTFASVDASVLAVEDTLSTVNAIFTAGLG